MLKADGYLLNAFLLLQVPMLLIRKHEMTGKQLAANRRNRKLAHGPAPYERAAEVGPAPRNAPLMQRMEDSSQRQLWRLTNTLIKVRNGVLSHRDVKNEGTSGDVYENKGMATKCTPINTAFYTKMHQFRDNGRQAIGLLGRTCTDYAINRGEVATTFRPALRGAKGRHTLV
jgi:hypothetical protein